MIVPTKKNPKQRVARNRRQAGHPGKNSSTPPNTKNTRQKKPAVLRIVSTEVFHVSSRIDFTATAIRWKSLAGTFL